MTRRLPILICLIAVLLPVRAGADTGVVQTPNVQVVARAAYTGGTELSFDGRYVYSGQMNGSVDRGTRPDQGGVLIFDTADGGFELVGRIDCPGTDNDVMVVRPGLVAVAHHSSRTQDGNNCNPATMGNGIFLADVSDPANPVVLGGVAVSSAHTLSVHPSGDYVYVNPGGLPGNGNMLEAIVDISDPHQPEVLVYRVPVLKPLRYEGFRGAAFGCHDLSFDIRPEQDRHLAFCAGGGEIQTWDVRDPANPVVIGRTTNPAIQFPHNAVVSPDGTKLVVNDEAFGLHECVSGTSLYGSLWIYDITVPQAPVPVGRIAPPTSRSTVGTLNGWSPSWCAAHNYNFVPGTNLVVTGWFTGGTTVHDITNPLLPVQVAAYNPGDGVTYTAHWFGGRVYVNDSLRGMEVLEVDGIEEGDLDTEAPVVTWPRMDRTRALLPPVLPPRPIAPAERSIERSIFCVIPSLV